MLNPYLEKRSPWSSHSQIAGILRSFPAGTRVLDVGTADGIIGRMLGKDTPLRVYGIEPHAVWAKQAEQYYQGVWVGMIEDAPESYISNFDVVVLADILEHTPAHEKVLLKLVALQHQPCEYVISVPNIANIYIRLNLLFGRFDYTERGILDKTHLRFFTRKSLIETVEQIGLKISWMGVTPIPLELLSPFFMTPAGLVIFRLFNGLTRLFPTLFGYQFIVRAKSDGKK